MDAKKQELTEAVGKRIRTLRHLQSISQEEVALRANLNPAYYGQVERGLKCPTIDTLYKIAQALGTSLPELVTAITSLVKGHGSLSLGNVIGANIFNLVLVSGAAATLAPFSVPQSSTIWGLNSSLVLEIPLMLFVMAFMTLPALITRKLQRYQGITLLVIYAAFCVLQFTM